jgi:hypothetical protein
MNADPQNLNIRRTCRAVGFAKAEAMHAPGGRSIEDPEAPILRPLPVEDEDEDDDENDFTIERSQRSWTDLVRSLS